MAEFNVLTSTDKEIEQRKCWIKTLKLHNYGFQCFERSTCVILLKGCNVIKKVLGQIVNPYLVTEKSNIADNGNPK